MISKEQKAKKRLAYLKRRANPEYVIKRRVTVAERGRKQREKQLAALNGALCLCGCGNVADCTTGYVYGHWFKGKPGRCCTEEIKQKMSRLHTGKGNPQYGIPITEKTKEKIRNALIGKNNPSYGKPRYNTKRINYNSPFQGTVCFRSSWEAAYAKYLDSINEPWFYELETFELLGGMTYTPDFFLPKQEKFVEVKGYFTDKSKIKFEKFKEEYSFDIEILFKQDLKTIGVI